MASAEQADVWGTIDGIVQLADPSILALASDPVGFLVPLAIFAVPTISAHKSEKLNS